VLPPDINRSQANFAIEKSDNSAPAIRFGLTAIKNVGTGAIEPIIAERDKGGEFKSIEDFCRRADLRGVNRRVMESLIKVGALDSLGSRGALLQSVNSILSLAQRQQQLKETGQSTMFDLWGVEMPVPLPGLDLETVDVSIKEKAAWEKELLGVSFSKQPFDKKEPGATWCGEIGDEMNGQAVAAVGEVAAVNYLFTRDRRPFISTTLEDISGSIEVMVWPKVYASTKDLWQEGNILRVEGKVRVRDDRVQLSCDKVDSYHPEVAQETEPPPAAQANEELMMAEQAIAAAAPVKSHRLVISLTQTSDEDSDVARLRKLVDTLKGFPGEDEVSLYIIKDGERVDNPLRLSSTGYCPALHQRLADLVGEGGLRVESNA
jgi:DNA polymerase-3 subunit alpha